MASATRSLRAAATAATKATVARMSRSAAGTTALRRAPRPDASLVWEPLKVGKAKAAKTRASREFTPLLAGGTADVFPTDAATAAYLKGKFAWRVAACVARDCKLSAEHMRYEIECELERMRLAGGVLGGVSLALALDLIATAKGPKRSLQTFRKWQRLGLPITPEVHVVMLSHYPVGRAGHREFYRECIERGGCREGDMGLMRAVLKAGSGAGVEVLKGVMKTVNGAVDDEFRALGLLTAVSEAQLDVAMRLLDVTSDDLKTNARFTPAIAASATTRRTAMVGLNVHASATGAPPDRTAWHRVLRACVREGAKRRWDPPRVQALIDTYDAATACEDGVSAAGYGTVLAGCRDAAAAIETRLRNGGDAVDTKTPLAANLSPMAYVVKFAEGAFAAAQAARRGFDIRQWIAMLQIYHAAGLPRRSLLLGRYYRATTRHLMRPTKAFLAMYIVATRGANVQSRRQGKVLPRRRGQAVAVDTEDTGAGQMNADVPRPRTRLVFMPIPARPYKRSEYVDEHAAYAPPSMEDADVRQKGFLPWVPGARPGGRQG